MTQHRDLKRRIRDRMAKTGETYVTARRHVLAARPDEPEPERPATTPIDVVETTDISEHAAALGLRCRVAMFPELAARVEPSVALARLRDALVGTADDPGIEVMRQVVFHGRPPRTRSDVLRFDELRAFIRRVRAGIGGASPGGRMLALVVEDVMMLCVAAATRAAEPIVYLQTSDEVVGRRNLSLFGIHQLP